MDKEIIEAKERLEMWLSDSHELGHKPNSIEYTNTFQDEDEINCMIFKYKDTPKSVWMLGIVSDSGVFSEMKEYIKENEIEDAKQILNMLKEYWKQRAKNILKDNK